MRDGKERRRSRTQQLLLKKLRESNLTTSDQRQRSQPLSHSLNTIEYILCIDLNNFTMRSRCFHS